MANVIDQFANYALSSINGGAGGIGTALNTSDTTLILPTGDGAKFPANGPYRVVIGSNIPGGSHEICTVTGRTTDTLFLTRSQEGTSTSVAWPVNTYVQETATAQSFNNIWNTLTGYQSIFNVQTYGAVGNGVTDDTAAIQSALNDCAVAGGEVLLTGHTFLISSSLIVASDNVRIRGLGRDSVLLATSGFSGGTPMIWYQSPTGFRYGAQLADFRLFCTNGSAYGVQLDSTYWATIRNVDFEGVYAISLYLNGGGSNFGAYTHIQDSHFGPIPGGPPSGGIGIKTNNHEWNKINRCTFAWFNISNGCAIYVQNDALSVTDCDFDVNQYSIWCYFSRFGSFTGNHFDRGYNRFIYLNGGQSNRFVGNDFETYGGSAYNTHSILIDNTGNNNEFVGNTWMTNTSWQGAVAVNTNVASTNVVYFMDNQFGGLAVVRQNGIFRNNPGYNPVGAVSAPALPATGTSVANTTGVDCQVHLSGTSVAAVLINNVTAGVGAYSYFVPANSTITVNYAGSPAWYWFGN